MVTNDIPVITIDGPSASGKGTVAQIVAKELEFHYLDSGALYRLVALKAMQTEADLANKKNYQILQKILMLFLLIMKPALMALMFPI